MTHPVYLEVTSKRVFAVSLDWPGWCRSARTEDAALQALVDYGRRYKKAARSPGRAFTAPDRVADLKVVDRVDGNATTEFGAPAMEIAADETSLGAEDLARQIRVLNAVWTTFDQVAAAAAGAQLRKGPRGGGRDVAAIVDHVIQADHAYLSKLGDKLRPPQDAPPTAWVGELRAAIVNTLKVRGRGEPAPNPPRRAALWSMAYFLRRSAWHALDHAWEIEDRRPG